MTLTCWEFRFKTRRTSRRPDEDFEDSVKVGRGEDEDIEEVLQLEDELTESEAEIDDRSGCTDANGRDSFVDSGRENQSGSKDRH
jgi:hypothetical protein